MSHRREVSHFLPMTLVEGAEVAIEAIRNDGMSEAVEVVNRGDADQPLTGWSLASLHGPAVYRFPDGLVLAPGESIVVTSGEGVAHRPPGVLGWTDRTVWNNRGDVALVFDCDGEEVARFAYPESRRSRLARLPRHHLTVEEDGRFRVEPVRREASRNRTKLVRQTPSR